MRVAITVRQLWQTGQGQGQGQIQIQPDRLLSLPKHVVADTSSHVVAEHVPAVHGVSHPTQRALVRDSTRVRSLQANR